MRKIVHVDMDAFYASIEQRDNPALRGRPVVVGGAPRSRGVVCTASYEARVFGVRSAMPAAEAYRRCPDAVFLKPDMARYRAVGEQVREIFRRYTDLVEPLSIDEAFLDVTEDRLGLGSATAIAEAVRQEIRAETRLTASAGVAPNKFLAKVASDMDKPDGLVVIPPARVAEVLADLPVRRIPGVGPKTAEVCKRFGIEVAGDFLLHTEDRLQAWFGDAATRYRALARGIDDRPVNPDRVRKSVSVEDTFGSDVVGNEACAAELRRLAEALAKRLADNDLVGSTVVLKVKYADFQQVTRSRTLPWPVHRADDLFATARALLDETEAKRRSVRLLGIGVSKLSGEERQLLLEFLSLPKAPPSLLPPPDSDPRRGSAMRRTAWVVGLVLIAQTGCATGASIAIATEVEDWTIDVEQVTAARIERGWKVDLRWADGEESELEWTPMAVLDQGNVHRTRPRIVPRVSEWFGDDRVLNGIFHTHRRLLLFKDGVQTAEYPIRRTEPISPSARYAVLAGLIPFTVAWDLATLPLQALGIGVIAIVIAVLEDEELTAP